jgi:hypothetical protein
MQQDSGLNSTVVMMLIAVTDTLWTSGSGAHTHNKVTPCMLTMSTARNKIVAYEGSHPARAMAIESADANPCVDEFQECQYMYVTIAT